VPPCAVYSSYIYSQRIAKNFMKFGYFNKSFHSTSSYPSGRDLINGLIIPSHNTWRTLRGRKKERTAK
jgi:hypothetical protein